MRRRRGWREERVEEYEREENGYEGERRWRSMREENGGVRGERVEEYEGERREGRKGKERGRRE